MDIKDQIVAELEELGYKDVRPLDELAYSNGVTHIFHKSQYFACYDENDPEWKLVIFNSNLKKLEITGSDRVRLTIKEATATVSSTRPEPSAWCVRQAEIDMKNRYVQFNTIKLRAAMDAADSDIEVAEFCGIVPDFKYSAPSSEISRWVVETKKMRDALIASNKAEITSAPEIWVPLLYIKGVHERTGKLTDAQRNFIMSNYEMRNTDGAIRHIRTKRLIEGVVPSLSAMETDATIEMVLIATETDATIKMTLRITEKGKPIRVRVEKHRAYMSTFKPHERRTHQDFIDHIDGNDSNNVPWNYRWMSTAENNLAKHSGMAHRIDPDIEKLNIIYGKPSDAIEWEGRTFHSNMWIFTTDGSRDIKRIGSGCVYPVIIVTLKDINNNSMKPRNILCHMIVAYLFRAGIQISKGALEKLASAGLSASFFADFTSSYFDFAKKLAKYGFVIKHADNDKSNYRVSNLEIGTPSENGLDRHDNLATTGRKRVKITDIASGTSQIFGSRTEAATYTKVPHTTVLRTARFNMTRDIATYRKTKNPNTGAEYYIVDV
jgi:hypothetical protein